MQFTQSKKSKKRKERDLSGLHVVGGGRGQVVVEDSLSLSLSHKFSYNKLWSVGLQNSARNVWWEINKYCVGGKVGCLCGGKMGLIKFEMN